MHAIPRLITWLFVTALIGVCIWQWHTIAIMPDEIAIRIQAGRYLQDHGTCFGLYALCADRVLPVPLILAPAAWLLSMGDLSFSSALLRLISIVSLGMCLATAAFYATTGRNKMSVLWLPAALMGVSASTLVYFRFETFITFNLTFIVLGLLCLHYHAPRIIRAVVAATLLFSLLCMAYTHPEAQLFIPVNAYITYRLLVGTAVKPLIIAAFALLFGYIGYTCFAFFQLSCKSYPGIEAFWNQMVSDPSNLQLALLPEYLLQKFNTFVKPFLYQDSYTINYLPGLSADVLAQPDITQINTAVQAALGLIMAAGLAVSAMLGWSWMQSIVIKKDAAAAPCFDRTIVFALIFFPTVFYFFYDANLYFYRTHFLNFLFVFSLAIGLSNCAGRITHYLTLLIGVLIIALTFHTHNLNEQHFVPKLKEYEGPSTSLYSKWILSPDEVLTFATNTCGIDVTQGGGIVSDYAHSVAKPYYRVYPMTYLSLQMSLAGIKAPEAIRILKPNYVLGRCTEMEQSGLGWPADQRLKDMCCTKLSVPRTK